MTTPHKQYRITENVLIITLATPSSLLGVHACLSLAALCQLLCCSFNGAG